ncbi:hypothetical protein QR680_009486 [Steinernema hermaphroditum]|uniref:DNA primase large subunit n=1 Tax=Steinernema hermaphroditum TaxID=289476 RepID=A0AA39IM84_9BILA|nr:hypothetical protein QR680_009486 [Steinernema hermaphroditum]
MLLGSTTPGRKVYKESRLGRLTASKKAANFTGRSVLSLYADPPTGTISLYEFEDAARSRLKVLKRVEEANGSLARGSQEWDDFLSKEIRTAMPIMVAGASQKSTFEKYTADTTSHFILRLAFCQSPDQMRWFIQHELDLFRFRFRNIAQDEARDFIANNKFKMRELKVSEAQELLPYLKDCGPSERDVTSSRYWKVYFTECPELVKNRKVFVRAGFAHVPNEDLISIFCTKLRANMANAMARASKQMSIVQEEDRLLPLLKTMTSNAYLGKEYKGEKSDEAITPDMIDSLAKKAFPLCMRQIHQRLKTDHHLRHHARRQYGLFLKGLGMSLENSLAFFRNEFTKKIDLDKFNKEYAYNIRHHYGKEGSHTESQAFPCPKIILGPVPTASDCHGCPYRHSDHKMLIQKLEANGLKKEQIESIMENVKLSKFDKACARFLECTHGVAEGALVTVITHPNQYFELSQSITSGKRSTEVVATSQVVIHPRASSQVPPQAPPAADDREAMDVEG